MNVLVTGGSGYVGSLLIPELIKNKYNVTSIDTEWFGRNLKKNKKLKIIKTDIRQINEKYFKNIDIVIHLACIANDPMTLLKENTSWEISLIGTMRILNYCINNKVKKFIYASSGSVYGIKKEERVHEELDLKPISLYNKIKMTTERLVLSYSNKIKTTIIRPATVCGLSPRLRLDLTVNALTYNALNKKKIYVHGGSQLRPNIHIKDLIRLYIFCTKKNMQGIFNAGFENLSVLEIAKTVSKKINCEIIVQKKKVDLRSYKIDSSKILKKGFKPIYTINDAIDEISECYKKNNLKISKKNFSINWLKNEIFR